MDDSELRARLQQLEERLDRLEAQLRPHAASAAGLPPPAPPPPEPPPLPRAAEPPPLPASVRAGPAAAGSDFERFVGLAVLGRVGTAALVLAAAYFGQLGWTHLGPGLRALCVYAGGLVLIGLGAWLAPRVAARYTALLWGGGTALTYLGGVLAHLRYDVVSSPVAIALLLASAALGQLLARRLGLQAMAVVALTGGYAAPVLVGTPTATPTAFFVLLLALHAWAAWIEHRWRWHAARAVAVGATAALVCAWYARHGPGPFWSFVGHVEAVWLALIAPEVLAALQRRDASRLRAVLAGVGGLLAQLAVFDRADGRDGIGALSLGVALLLLGGGAAVGRRGPRLGEWLARAGSVLLPLAVVVATEGGAAAPHGHAWRLGGLVATAALLVATRRWTGVAELGLATAALLGLLTAADAPGAGRGQVVPVLALPLLLLASGRSAAARIAGLLLAVVAAFLGLAPLDGLAGAHGAWTALAFTLAGGAGAAAVVVASRRRDPLLLGFAVVVEASLLLAWAAAAAASGRSGGEPQPPLANARTGALLALVAAALGGRRLLAAQDRVPRVVLAAAALGGIYAGALFELRDAVAGWSFGARALASSLYTLAFAAALLVAGFRRRLPSLRWVALAGFAFVVVKIGAHDLAGLDPPLRVLATGVLGGVLLVAAWAYARGSRGAPPT